MGASLEQRLYSTYWDDGLLDLVSGLALVIIGVGWVMGLGPLAVIHAPVWVVLWPSLHRSLVEPRSGYVEFSRERRTRSERGLRWAVGLGLAALVLVVTFAGVDDHVVGAGIGELVAGLPAALISIPAFLAGLLTGARRFFVYAVVLLVGAGVTGVAGWSPAVPITVAGSVAAVTGAILIARFVRSATEFQESRRS